MSKTKKVLNTAKRSVKKAVSKGRVKAKQRGDIAEKTIARTGAAKPLNRARARTPRVTLYRDLYKEPFLLGQMIGAGTMKEMLREPNFEHMAAVFDKYPNCDAYLVGMPEAFFDSTTGKKYYSLARFLKRLTQTHLSFDVFFF